MSRNTNEELFASVHLDPELGKLKKNVIGKEDATELITLNYTNYFSIGDLTFL